MLTKGSEKMLAKAIAVLISLALAGSVPFWGGAYVSAVEEDNLVDIISDGVEYEGSEMDEETVDETSEDEEEIDSESEKEKKNGKNKKKSKKDKETNVGSENSSDESEDADADSEEGFEVAAAEDNDSDEDADNDIYNEENELTDEESNDEDDNSTLTSDGEDTDSDEDADEQKDKDKKDKKESKGKKDKDKDKDSDDEDVATDDEIIDGFPSSYMPMLEEMKAEHPNWTFVPVETGVTFKEAVKAENQGSTSLISPSAPKAQRHDSGKQYDGTLYRANKKTISYYMDPRNFLNESDVFQFLQQSYDDDSQNVDTVASVIDGSFMDGEAPCDEFETFQACIDDVGEETGVNSNVLAAMIIQEQGWDGSSLVSGKKDGYEGYYNFFNIGAWTTAEMSNSERGLWYAKGEGEDATSYERPWDSPYKAILGGAQFYYENYVSANQDTYYTKKFNVGNGADAIGEHQYMTNLDAANDEGKLVRKAYENNPDVAATFKVPVYSEMPAEQCELPE